MIVLTPLPDYPSGWAAAKPISYFLSKGNDLLERFDARYGPFGMRASAPLGDWEGVGDDFRRYLWLLEEVDIFQRPDIHAKPFFQRALALYLAMETFNRFQTNAGAKKHISSEFFSQLLLFLGHFRLTPEHVRDQLLNQGWTPQSRSEWGPRQ